MLKKMYDRLVILRFIIACVLFVVAFVELPEKVIAQDDGVRQLLQELFVGESVYPQERNELQLTTGLLWAHRGNRDIATPVLFEYGITDRFQLEAVFPVEYLQRESGGGIAGLGNVALGAYWNFLNRPETGWAAGIGFELGLPTATTGIGEDGLIYEPFFIVYREFDCVACNVSAGVEILDSYDDESETIGELAVAIIRSPDASPFVYLLEAGIEIEPDETNVLIAPGIYWQPLGKNWELGAALPIGLTESVSNIGVAVQFTIEFGGNGGDDDDDDDDNGDERDQ